MLRHACGDTGLRTWGTLLVVVGASTLFLTISACQTSAPCGGIPEVWTDGRSVTLDGVRIEPGSLVTQWQRKVRQQADSGAAARSALIAVAGREMVFEQLVPLLDSLLLAGVVDFRLVVGPERERWPLPVAFETATGYVAYRDGREYRIVNATRERLGSLGASKPVAVVLAVVPSDTIGQYISAAKSLEQAGKPWCALVYREPPGPWDAE
jgi:hypothetical protein